MKKIILLFTILNILTANLFSKDRAPFYIFTDTKLYSKAIEEQKLNERYSVFKVKLEDDYISQRYDLYRGNEETSKRLIDLKTGNEVILDGLTGFKTFDTSGDFKVPVYVRNGWPQFYLEPDLKSLAFSDQEFRYISPFYNGTAIVTYFNPPVSAIINTKGKIIRNDIKYSAGYFTEGLVAVTLTNGESVFLDTKGKAVITIPKGYELNCDYAPDFEFHEGYVSLATKEKENRKSIIIDKNGKITGQAENIFIYHCKDGLFPFIYCNEPNKYGFMDNKCTIIIPAVIPKETRHRPQYFENGELNFKFNGRQVTMYKNGEVYDWNGHKINLQDPNTNDPFYWQRLNGQIKPAQ